MRKKKRVPVFATDRLVPYLHPVWTGLAVLFWTAAQFFHLSGGNPFSWEVFTKGLVLLLEASAFYALSGFKGFYFLGMFPLPWLALSRFQWDICSPSPSRFWLWLVLFMGMEILILALPDGKKLLFLLAPLWACLIWLFKFSFLLPLAFVTVPKKRFRNAPWLRWGGLTAALVFYALFRGWAYFQFSWIELYEPFFENRFITFFLMAWLGWMAFDPRWKGTFRHGMIPFFLLTLGFSFWGGNGPNSWVELEALQWVLVLMAGVGWEAFRKYLMDESWHGRAVWFALGVALFGGVL